MGRSSLTPFQLIKETTRIGLSQLDVIRELMVYYMLKMLGPSVIVIHVSFGLRKCYWSLHVQSKKVSYLANYTKKFGVYVCPCF